MSKATACNDMVQDMHMYVNIRNRFAEQTFVNNILNAQIILDKKEKKRGKYTIFTSRKKIRPKFVNPCLLQLYFVNVVLTFKILTFESCLKASYIIVCLLLYKLHSPFVSS